MTKQNNLPTGKSWFFGIGIDEYQDERIPNLSYAVRDVEAIYQRLKEDYDLGEDTRYHHFLTNERATRRAIIDKFNILKPQTTLSRVYTRVKRLGKARTFSEAVHSTI